MVDDILLTFMKKTLRGVYSSIMGVAEYCTVRSSHPLTRAETSLTQKEREREMEVVSGTIKTMKHLISLFSLVSSIWGVSCKRNDKNDIYIFFFSLFQVGFLHLGRDFSLRADLHTLGSGPGKPGR